MKFRAWLQSVTEAGQLLFDPKPKIKQVSCDLDLSAYKKHIKQIQDFAWSNPNNFAQVMMFSPLSAHTSFSRHWENFPVLMSILKDYFGDREVDRNELEHVVSRFDKAGHSLKATISSFKFDTIAYIWNNREALFNKMQHMAKTDLVELISFISKIKGIAPVKAGFIVQLLFGRAGCIDTHNIDIYKAAFPELADQLDMDQWDKSEAGVKKYVQLLDVLEKKFRIGTQELWDIWVDFIENFYKTIGINPFASMGPSLHPDKYARLKDVEVEKSPPAGVKGYQSGEKIYIPAVSGEGGGGASATHLPTDIGRFGDIKKGSPESAIPPRRSTGELTPLAYFGKYISDPEARKQIIKQMAQSTNRAERIAAAQEKQGILPIGDLPISHKRKHNPYIAGNYGSYRADAPYDVL